MSNSNLEALVRRPVGPLLWEYSIPAIVGMLAVALCNIVDRIFIGQVVGPDAIAGLTVTFPVMNVATALGVLVGAGAAARTSILLGNGDHGGALKVLGNTVSLILINATAYLTVFAVFINEMLMAFGASEATLPYAREYMIYMMPGMFIINVTFTLNNVMRASGFPRKAMVTMLIGAGLNILLDPLFIYLFDMGIKGAAIATDLAMGVSMFFVLRHFTLRESPVRFMRGIYGLERAVVLSIVSIGAAPCVVNVASCLINIIINNSLYSYGGDNAVAAAGIFATFTSMLVSVIIGICQGMQPIIGYNYGAGHHDRLVKTYWLAVSASTAICGLGWIIGMTVPHWVALVFTVDMGLVNVTSNALSISMVCFFMVGFQIVSTTLFQSLGRAGKSIFLGLTRQVLFLIPLMFILRHYYGLDGIWAAFPSGDACATVVTVWLVAGEMSRLRHEQEIRTSACRQDGDSNR